MFKNKNVRGAIAVIILFSLLSLSCGVLSNVPFMATETPTLTATFTPSPTPVPSSTPMPTATPLRVGVNAEQQADGSTLFTDYDNQYRLVLPEEWIIIPLNQDDLGVLVEKLSQDNPEFKDAAETFKNLDPDVFRLVALSQNQKYLKGGSIPNINVTGITSDALFAMPLSFITGALEESFKQNGMTVISAGVSNVANSHGVEIGYLDVVQITSGIEVAQRVMVFKSEKKVIMITLTTASAFQADVFASGDLIGDSVELLK